MILPHVAIGAVAAVSPVKVTVQSSSLLASTYTPYLGLNVEFYPETWVALKHPKVRFLSKQLSPLYLRVGGNSADETGYDVYSGACDATQICLKTEDLWTIHEYAEEAGYKVVLNLNEWYPYSPDPVVDPNQGSRQPRPGPFVNTNNAALLRYMAQNPQVTPEYLTLGNELTDNLTPEEVASDYAVLAAEINKLWPDSATRPKLMGPDCFWQNGSWVETFSTDPVTPPLHAFTWHMYLMNRTATAEDIIDRPEVLDTEVPWTQAYVDVLANNSVPWPLWITETGVAWGGELNGTADRFVGGFWWLDQLAQLAAVGVKAQHRHTVYAYTEGWASSFLGTTEDEYEPRPDYWTSLLWTRLVGPGVLRADLTDATSPSLRVYAHCSADNDGSVVLIVLNLSRNETVQFSVNSIDADGGYEQAQELYLLSAEALDSKIIRLNGHSLHVYQGDDNEPYLMPSIKPLYKRDSIVEVPPLTYGYVHLVEMYATVCDMAQ